MRGFGFHFFVRATENLEVFHIKIKIFKNSHLQGFATGFLFLGVYFGAVVVLDYFLSLFCLIIFFENSDASDS
jgi:hypothetical protein